MFRMHAKTVQGIVTCFQGRRTIVNIEGTSGQVRPLDTPLSIAPPVDWVLVA